MAGHDTERITLAELPSGVDIETTVHTYTGDTAGPTVYVQAAQHGRELNGIGVCRRFHDHVNPGDLTGEVIMVPVANPLTVDRRSYTAPESIDRVNPNMNRVWPGMDRGGIHQRLAATLWDRAGDADAIVDLHTGSPKTVSHVVYTDGDEQSHDLARAFGTDLLLAEPRTPDADEEWSARGFDRKLRAVAYQNEIPAITPELGSCRRLETDAIDTGLAGLCAVLDEMEMYDSDRSTGNPRQMTNHGGRVHADHPGLFLPDSAIRLGEVVEAGTRLGEIFDPTTYEQREVVEMHRRGFLYTLRQEATVNGGDQLAAVAINE